MRKPILSFFSGRLKTVLSCGLSLCLLSCGTSGGGGKSAIADACQLPQEQQSSLQAAFFAAPVSATGLKQMIVQLSVREADSQKLRADLEREYSDHVSELKIRKISDKFLAVELPGPSETSKVLATYLQEGRILSLEPDQKTFSSEVASDSDPGLPAFANLSGSGLVNRELLAKSKSGKPLVVAVIDSGIDPIHQDLAPFLWKNEKEIPGNHIDDDGNGYIDDVYGWDFVNEDNEPVADDSPNFHGTHVSGIVKQAALLAEEGINVKIMPLKYLDDQAVGKTSNAVRAIEYAINNGAIVLNNSWGSTTYSAALATAVEKARKAKVLFVAAAGNGDAQGRPLNIDKVPFYPAAYARDNIISVAATDNRGVLAPWSNYGSQTVDLAAPGMDIVSTRNGNSYGRLSGTSMAAPYVSGVAALIWSLRPELSFFEVRKILAQSSLGTPSLSGKVATNSVIQRTQALKIATTYIHDPNDQGGDLPSNGICGQ